MFVVTSVVVFCLRCLKTIEHSLCIVMRCVVLTLICAGTLLGYIHTSTYSFENASTPPPFQNRSRHRLHQVVLSHDLLLEENYTTALAC